MSITFKLKYGAELQPIIKKWFGWQAEPLDGDLRICIPDSYNIIHLSKKFEITDLNGYQSIKSSLLSEEEIKSAGIKAPEIKKLHGYGYLGEFSYYSNQLTYLSKESPKVVETLTAISGLLVSYSNAKYMSHLSIDLQYITGILRLQKIMFLIDYYVQKQKITSPINTAAYKEEFKKAVNNALEKKDNGEGIFPISFDFLNFVDSFLKASPLIHTISTGYGNGQLHYFSEKSFVLDYISSNNFYQLMYVSDENNLTRNILPYLNHIAADNSDEIYEYLKIACKAINNLFSNIFIGKYFIDENGFIDCLKLLKASSALLLLFNSLISQNFSNSYHHRIQVCFSFLDKFANFVLGLKSFNTNDYEKENKIFKKLLTPISLKHTLEIFKENMPESLFNRYSSLIDAVCESINDFSKTLENEDSLREIRHFFIHGSFESSPKGRLENIFLQSKWPIPHGVFLLPQVWMLAFCLSPEKVVTNLTTNQS